MSIIDLTDEQNAKRWKVQEPQTLTDEQIEHAFQQCGGMFVDPGVVFAEPIDYSKHTAAEDSREGCAGDDMPESKKWSRGECLLAIVVAGLALWAAVAFVAVQVQQ